MDSFLGLFTKKSEKISDTHPIITRSRRASTVSGYSAPKMTLDIQPPQKVIAVEEPIKSIVMEKKTLKYFRDQDFNRSKFNFEIVSCLNWWPDEILHFLEVLRLAYVNFINIYLYKANLFDAAIRNAIFFMNQNPYCKLPAISKFLKTGNYAINDNYWLIVSNEDNCYMSELEDRNRSPNEQKHYLLLRALEELLTQPLIKYNNMVFEKDYEHKLRIFVTIYNLKNAYAMVDDACKTTLQAAIDGISLDFSLNDLFKGMITEINNKMIFHMKKVNDIDLVTTIYTFYDIIAYALYNTTQFNHVFTPNLTQQLNPFASEFYQKFYTSEVLNRITYVYSYYINIIKNKDYKDKLILETSDFTVLQNKNIQLPLLTPKYTIKYLNAENCDTDYEKEFVIDFIDDTTLTTARHRRVNTVNALVTPRKYFPKK